MTPLPVRRALRTLAVALPLAWSIAAAPAQAQASRTALLDSARARIDDFDERRAIPLLRRAVDPALGARDAEWGRGVQLLAQTLLQTDARDAAAAWLRWALRLSPDLAADSVNFTPALVAALDEARRAVRQAPVPERVTIRHAWLAALPDDGLGELLVERAGAAPGARVTITVEGDTLELARVRRLPAGSYRFVAAGGGAPELPFTTEVLPGVTTRVSVSFPAVVADGAKAQPAGVTPPTQRGPAEPQPTVVGAGPKKRSKLLPILGGVAVGGIVAALAGGSGSGGGGSGGGTPPPTTGGITIRLP